MCGSNADLECSESVPVVAVAPAVGAAAVEAVVAKVVVAMALTVALVAPAAEPAEPAAAPELPATVTEHLESVSATDFLVTAPAVMAVGSEPAIAAVAVATVGSGLGVESVLAVKAASICAFHCRLAGGAVVRTTAAGRL